MEEGAWKEGFAPRYFAHPPLSSSISVHKGCVLHFTDGETRLRDRTVTLLGTDQGNPPHSKPPPRGFERSRLARRWAHPPPQHRAAAPRGPRIRGDGGWNSGTESCRTGGSPKRRRGSTAGEESRKKGGQFGGRWGRDRTRTGPHARHPMAPLTPRSSELLGKKARGPRRGQIAPGQREGRGRAGLAGAAAGPRGLRAARARPSEPAAAGARGSGRDARLGPGAALGGCGMRGRQGPPPESPGPRPPPRPRRSAAGTAGGEAGRSWGWGGSVCFPSSPATRGRAAWRDRFARRCPALPADLKCVLQNPFPPWSTLVKV